MGNSPVIVDADGDGVLDGYFGSRTKYLLRVNMRDLTLIAQRPGWSQCGCYTTAMNVDHDGRWDLFAGSGDDELAKGVLHRYEPISLESKWELPSNDNASSADMVLVDIDNDGEVEIIKSVDNYHHDDPHDAVYALETDGTVLRKVAGISKEDSPNVADLDGDGAVEIVGMTFGGEVYCLDASGHFKWRKDLRPEFDDAAHAYVSPMLCDVDGDEDLEILAMTNGPFYTGELDPEKPHGIVFALSAGGEILIQLDVGSPRYWNEAFYCNVDDDPQMELAVAGWGGLDVIETNGFGADAEVFQRRRTYQRLNVYPWAYEDTYFLSRGEKQHVRNLTDDLVLERNGDQFQSSGRFRTELLTLPPHCTFTSLTYDAETPPRTKLVVNVLDAKGAPLVTAVESGSASEIDQPVKLEFVLSTDDAMVTPRLDAYSLRFTHDQM